MYSEADLDDAVRAGVLEAPTVAAFRAYIAERRATPAVDEEQFRLVTSFNDIFVSIATVLVLIALHSHVSPLFTAAVSWALAEVFTRQRRMALPSILLMAAFVASIGELVFTLTVDHVAGREAFAAAAAGLAGSGAALMHWTRFKVPVTVAAVTGCVAVAVIAVVLGLLGPEAAAFWWRPLVIAGGLAIFAYALWWDMRDRERQTRRADVAFWLHLLAAPALIHPLFSLIVELDNPAVMVAVAVGLYLVLILVALAIDRRALLVSALGYVLYAVSVLIEASGRLDEGLTITALGIGLALLVLSALWGGARRLVVNCLPATLQARLPTL